MMIQPGTSMTRDVRPPDLEMQVRTQSEHGRTWLKYTLHSPTGAVGFSHYSVTGPAFHGNPDEFHRYLLSKIEQLGDRLDFDGSYLLNEGVDRKLVSFGRALWRELIPPEIRAAYREIRRSVRSWMIISDEPWIPWELIKPYDDSRPEKILDDDFLALQFELTRWLAGRSTPAREITVRSFAALETADLPQVKEERILLEDLKGASPGLSGEAPACDSVGEILSYLETCDAQLLHFMGHGSLAASRADEAGIPLPDGSALRPLDLEGPVATRILRNQPLVFLNTCWAGQQGWSLTRLGGWASRWVGVCGCSAFVAPMWPVRTQIALSFARAFYDALAGGAPLGEAAWKARRQIYQERSGDPSVLAYVVYGHPHARVTFGTGVSTEEAFSVSETRGERRIQWRPHRRRWRPRWIGAAAALIFAAIVHLSADPVLDRFLTMDVSAVPQSLLDKRPEPPREPRKEPEAVRPSRATTTEVKVGGLRFVISGGTSSLTYPLKQALSRAAQRALEEELPEGTSGWTFRLRLGSPTTDSHADGSSPLVLCRLRAEASAEGPGSSIDLGPMEAVNSQPDGSQACEAATERLAETVLFRFVRELGTKGEQ
ncbi:MAG TPA: CHAT domain-containing protein [Thermoanaerobaculia bacterium]